MQGYYVIQQARKCFGPWFPTELELKLAYKKVKSFDVHGSKYSFAENSSSNTANYRIVTQKVTEVQKFHHLLHTTIKVYMV